MDGGVQTVNINDTCYQSGVVHEIGHALGLFHEQQRQDRGTWVTFGWCVTGDALNFGKQTAANETDVSSFDFNSIMLYSGCNQCAVDANHPAPAAYWMTKNSNGQCFGAANRLCAGDINGTKWVYGDWHATDIGAPGLDFAAGSAKMLYGVQPDGGGVPAGRRSEQCFPASNGAPWARAVAAAHAPHARR